MEIAKSLVKCVARAFYDTKHILVVDALMIHNAVRDDELAKLLGMQNKDLHKLCGKLKEDRMLMVHTRPEQKEGQQRPVNRTYYYVEFRATIDAVKFRMHGVVKDVEKKMNKDADTKGYVCPYCQKRFAVMDALTLEQDDVGMFLCDRCSTCLADDDDSTEVKVGQERLGRLMEQMRRIIDLLKKIDEVFVPSNDFDTAIANSVPVPRDKNQLSSIPTGPGGNPVNNSNRSGAPTSLEINFTSTSEKTAAEAAAEQARKQAQAEKNALPVWHTQSTVDPNAITAAGAKEAAEKEARAIDGIGIAARTKLEEDQKAAVAEGTNGGVQADAIAEYYAALAAQKAAEEAEEEAEEEDDDDEGEDEEFEDLDVLNGVGTTNTTATGSAATTPVPTITTTSAATAASSSKRAQESDEDAAGVPAAKKIKTNPTTTTTTTTTSTTTPEEEDSDEEADFEDV